MIFLNDDHINKFVLSVAETVSTFRRFGVPTAHDLKVDNSPVTLSDKVVQEKLIILAKGILDVPVIAEEAPAIINPDELRSALIDGCWVIDPIDGTENFAGGGYLWATVIAFVKDCVPIFGLICAPDISFVAWSGDKNLFFSFINTNGSFGVPIDRILIRTKTPNFIYCTEKFLRMHRFGDVLRPRTFGAISMNMMEVVLGRAVAAITQEYIWDFVALWALGKMVGLELFDLTSGDRIQRLSMNLFNQPDDLRLRSPAILTTKANVEIIQRNIRRIQL